MLEDFVPVLRDGERRQGTPDDVSAFHVQQPAACQVDVADQADRVQQRVANRSEIEERDVASACFLEASVALAKFPQLDVELPIG